MFGISQVVKFSSGTQERWVIDAIDAEGCSADIHNFNNPDLRINTFVGWLESVDTDDFVTMECKGGF